MKKIYDKPEIQIVMFDLKDNLMVMPIDEDAGITTPSIGEDVEDGW